MDVGAASGLGSQVCAQFVGWHGVASRTSERSSHLEALLPLGWCLVCSNSGGYVYRCIDCSPVVIDTRSSNQTMKLTTTAPMSWQAFLDASFLAVLPASASSGGSLSFSR